MTLRDLIESLEAASEFVGLDEYVTIDIFIPSYGTLYGAFIDDIKYLNLDTDGIVITAVAP